MPEGFRIRALEIEGFKGFTKHQRLDIEGRHIFLLGRNGNGKSSVVEAIRWGLFGSLNRRNELVENIRYSGDCRVVIALTRDNRRWNLRRNLVIGDPDRASLAVLTDESGRVHPIRTAIPSLDSSDAGEGTHIIFSSQSEPLQRQPEDLDAFQRTVLNHLGLLRPKALLNEIDKFLEENEEIVGNFDGRLSVARYNINSEIARLQKQISDEFLNPAPWGDELPPTLGDSENKARDLIQEISGIQPDGSLAGVSLAALIMRADEVLKEWREQTVGELERESKAIGLRRQKLETLQSRIVAVDSAETYSRHVQSQIKSELGNVSIDDIRKKLDAAKAAMSVEELKAQIVDATIALLEHGQSGDFACPICAVEHPLLELRESVNQHKESTEVSYSETANRLSEQESLLERAEELESKMRLSRISLESAKQAHSEDLSNLDVEDKDFAEEATRDDLSERITQLSNRESSLNGQINNRQKTLDDLESRRRNLRAEARFLQINERLLAQEERKRNFERAQRAFENLESFRESVINIRKVVEERFKERMRDEIPSVSDLLSEVFADLTQHSYYDKLVFDEDALDEAKLILRVASSADDAIPMDVGVLNGQARSAQELVPYFAFSQFEDATTEILLLILDYPTRAFDEEHTEILVEYLARLGQRVQLIIASHETERFRELLPKHFDEGSYTIVEPTNWSSTEGPELSIEHK